MDIRQGLTQPTSFEGKVDPGEGLAVYYTAKWSDGVQGKMDDRFKALRDAGYRCYRWDQPNHYVHGAPEQVESIKSFYESGECAAFIFEYSSNDYPHGATTLLMGYIALATDIPILFIGSEDCRLFKNLVGAKLKEDNRVQFHATFECALEALQFISKPLRAV